MGKIRTRNQHQAEFVKCIQKFGGKAVNIKHGKYTLISYQCLPVLYQME